MGICAASIFGTDVAIKYGPIGAIGVPRPPSCILRRLSVRTIRRPLLAKLRDRHSLLSAEDQGEQHLEASAPGQRPVHPRFPLPRARRSARRASRRRTGTSHRWTSEPLSKQPQATGPSPSSLRPPLSVLSCTPRSTPLASIMYLIAHARLCIPALCTRTSASYRVHSASCPPPLYSYAYVLLLYTAFYTACFCCCARRVLVLVLVLVLPALE